MDIIKLFELERPTYIMCINSDNSYHITEGTKYKIEEYTTRNGKLFMKFINDVNWEMEFQVGESSKHFIPLIDDRKRKLDRIMGRK